VPALFPTLPARQAAFLREVSYTQTAVVTFRLESRRARPGATVVFPVNEVEDLASINPHLPVDEDGGSYAFVKVFLSNTGYKRLGGLGDEELSAAVADRVGMLGDWARWVREAVPVDVWRWPEALPRFDVGYIKALRAADLQAALPRVAFAGDYVGGPFLEGAVMSGFAAAERILAAPTGATPD
jgi:protoporphyrinogen/coproporphyrinogen III oxidase